VFKQLVTSTAFHVHRHDRPVITVPHPSLPPSLPPSLLGNDIYKDIEALANSLAVASKKGIDRHLLKSLSDEDPVWDGVAHALGSLCATLVLMVSVERIVISGGRGGGREGGREGTERKSVFPRRERSAGETVKRSFLTSCGYPPPPPSLPPSLPPSQAS
jgi:hypothetical protein